MNQTSTIAAIMMSVALGSAGIARADMPASSQDAGFARKAAQAGLAEVALGRLALRKSTAPEVVAFAHRMIHDHGQANERLSQIVAHEGLPPTTSVGAQNRALMVSLEAQHGAAFNQSYLHSQLPAHRQVLTLFKTEAANGSNAELVAFAKQTIPVIEMHIAMDKREIAGLDGMRGRMSMR